jgi:hypothetical protein
VLLMVFFTEAQESVRDACPQIANRFDNMAKVRFPVNRNGTYPPRTDKLSGLAGGIPAFGLGALSAIHSRAVQIRRKEDLIQSSALWRRSSGEGIKLL